MKIYFRQTVGILLILALARCKEEYIPDVKESNTRLLVVEGYINSGSGKDCIKIIIGFATMWTSPHATLKQKLQRYWQWRLFK